MPTRSPRTGQCIFCAFRALERPTLPILSPRRRTTAIRSLSSLPPLCRKSSSRQSLYPNRKDGDGETRPPVVRRVTQLTPITRTRNSVRGEQLTLSFAGPKDVVRRVNPQEERSRVNILKLRDIVIARLGGLEPELRNSPVMDQSGNSQEVDTAIATYRQYIYQALSSTVSPVDTVLQQTLLRLYVERGEQGLDSQLKYAFYGHVLGGKFSSEDIRNQKEMADLRYPLEWHPHARTLHRTIHVHIGPTNSGKTYHALKRLEEAKFGIYAGPLRLLAHEVYSRLNAKGFSCLLVTGEEQRMPEGYKHAERRAMSCTVEMVPLNHPVDVAVLDEIQMLGSKERGWAWTNAFLGLKAQEIHVCGEVRALPLVQQLAAAVGDKVIVHRYDRLTPLETEQRSLGGNYHKLRKGDCVVSFSVMGIHAIRQEIEKATGKKVAIVYGSLPPETRAQQARLFNDPDNDYDFLVASDAIGMGLNLSIKRIIFESVHKNNGQKIVQLTDSEIRQIAGRAGRYRTAAQDTQAAAAESSDDGKSLYPAPPAQPNIGRVTTLEHMDLPIVQRAMMNAEDPLTSAGIAAPPGLVHRFSAYFPPGTPFSYILIRLNEISKVNHRYHLCTLKDAVEIADAIHPIKDLTINDRIILCNAPCSMRIKELPALMQELATCIANQSGGNILEIQRLDLELLEEEVDEARENKQDRLYLKKLEALHKGVILYLWLTYRFPGVFMSRPLATHIKETVETNIAKTLKRLSFDPNKRKFTQKMQREAMLLDEIRRGGLMGEDDRVENSESGVVLNESGDQRSVVESSEFQDSHLDGNEPEEAKEMLADARMLGEEQEPLDDEGEYPEEGDLQAESQTSPSSEFGFTETSMDTPLSSVDDDDEGVDAESDELDDDAASTRATSVSSDATNEWTAEVTSCAPWREREMKPFADKKKKEELVDSMPNDQVSIGDSQLSSESYESMEPVEANKAEESDVLPIGPETVEEHVSADSYPVEKDSSSHSSPFTEDEAPSPTQIESLSAMEKEATRDDHTDTATGTKPSKTPTTYPLQSIQISNSADLARLIAQQQRQQREDSDTRP